MSTRLGRDNESTPIKCYMPGCLAKRQDSGACTPRVESGVPVVAFRGATRSWS